MRPIDVMRARGAAASGGDPNFASVVSLVHFDGADASTTITDVKGKAWTASGAEIDTAQAKFGGSSLFVKGGYVSCAAFGNLGTGDFTLEGWVRATSTSTRGIFHTAQPSNASGLALGYDSASGLFQMYHTGTVSNSGSGLLVVNTWQHWAVERVGTSLKAYINGVAAISVTNSSNFNGHTGMNLGVYYNNVFPTIGHLDEFRATVGVARYGANFTPPTAPFPDS